MSNSTDDLVGIPTGPDPKLISYSRSYDKPNVIDAKGEVPIIVKTAGWTPGIAFFGICFILLGAMQISFYNNYKNIHPDEIWMLKTSGVVFTIFGIIMVIGAIVLYIVARNTYLKILAHKGFAMPKTVYIYQNEESLRRINDFPVYYGSTGYSERPISREISHESFGKDGSSSGNEFPIDSAHSPKAHRA